MHYSTCRVLIVVLAFSSIDFFGQPSERALQEAAALRRDREIEERKLEEHRREIERLEQEMQRLWGPQYAPPVRLMVYCWLMSLSSSFLTPLTLISKVHWFISFNLFIYLYFEINDDVVYETSMCSFLFLMGKLRIITYAVLSFCPVSIIFASCFSCQW